jgi:DNA polymerase-1
MAANARIERVGIPIDVGTLTALQKHWKPIMAGLIAGIDKYFWVFEKSAFKAAKFAKYLERENISWKRLNTGALDLKEETFAEAAATYPQLKPLHELRVTLGQMRLSALAVGADGRNRTLLSAFAARTGRNQPSNTKFVFGPAVWLRSLIQPPEGFGIAYVDWSQQEFGIAAALSQDPAMLQAYLTGDPYLAFAKLTGAVPADATKASHGEIRDIYKAVILGVQYGMEAESLGRRIGQPFIIAHNLLQQHRRQFPVFWQWLNTWRDKVNRVRGASNLRAGPAESLAASGSRRSWFRFGLFLRGAGVPPPPSPRAL